MGEAITTEKGQIMPESAAAEAPSCRHHWIIESPRGVTSKGRCKLCGAEREFRNSANDNLWEDDSLSSLSRWGGSKSIPVPSDDDEVAASPRSGGQPALIL